MICYIKGRQNGNLNILLYIFAHNLSPYSIQKNKKNLKREEVGFKVELSLGRDRHVIGKKIPTSIIFL